jgi:hypothetical protein
MSKDVQKAITKRESARKAVTPVPSEQSEKVDQLDDSLKAAQTKTNQAYKGKKEPTP